jgi:ABC-2 type transport system ATP-binding protein
VASPDRVVALLGPNGAGKTTFVRAVATLLRPDAGTLHVAGIDALRHPARVRQLIGLAGQFAAVEQAMTGRENLEMVGRLFGLSHKRARAAATAVLEQLRLTEDAGRLVRTYSGGMRRRLDLGVSLVGAPRLLLLDEPTAGLDPGSRAQLWDAIRQLVAAGTDVLLTTQYLDEADQLAADVVIIDHGKVIAAGTPAELKTLAGDDVIEVHVATPTRSRRGEGALDRRRRPPGRPRHPPGIGGGGRIAPIDGGGARPGPGRRPHRGHLAAAPDAGRGLPHPHREADRQQRLGRRPRGRLNRPLNEGSTMAHVPVSTGAPPSPLTARVNSGAGFWASSVAVALRTIRKFVRTPQLLALATVQSAIFLLIFRYIFGGALAVEGVSYVDFLVPGFVATGILFSGMGAAAGVAEDVDQGFFDRLRSLPIPRAAVMAGRCLADTALVTWSAVVAAGLGFAVGFRLHGSVPEGLAALGLCVVFSFAFEWLFITIGLVAGNAQAAQGIAVLGGSARLRLQCLRAGQHHAGLVAADR